jgi:mono/diheme cytochrome c family protein
VTGNMAPLVKTILSGRSSGTKSKTAAYGEQMPALSFLKDEEIAAIATYIRNSWNNHADSVDAADIIKARQH